MSTLVVLHDAALVALFLGLGLVGFAAARAPEASPPPAGLRGLARQRALASGGGWAQLEPVVRWLGRHLRGLLSDAVRADLDRRLARGGEWLGLRPEELVALSVVGSVFGAAFGVVANVFVRMGPGLPLAVAGFGAIAPQLALSSATADRLKAIGRRLPSAVDLLSLGMSAGLDLPGALREAVSKSGTPDDPLIEELSLVLVSLKLGRSRREALTELAERAPTEPVQEFVAAVVQAEQRGNPVAEVLRIQAEISRQKRSVRAEEAAARAGVAMITPLALVFLAILILIAVPMLLEVRNHLA